LRGSGVVDPQVRVPVEHQESLSEQRRRMPYRAKRPERRRPVIAVGDTHAEALGTDPLLHLFAQVAHAQHHPAGAAAGEQPQLVVQEWLARHIEERLGR
jgi:hypothetical protein